MEGVYSRSNSNISIKDVKIDKLLLLAKKNNLLYYVCLLLNSNYRDYLSINDQKYINSVIERGGLEIERIKSSLKIISNNLESYLLIKTFRGYPRIANDLDLLVNDFDLGIKVLKGCNLVLSDLDPDLKEVVFTNENVFKIHLHGRVAWLNRSYFDNDLLWNSPRNVIFFDHNVMIPNFTADFLIHLAHMNYEPMHFTLSELVYLYSIAKEVDWSVVELQAKKYQWHGALIRTLKIFDCFHWRFYGEPSYYSRLVFNNNEKRHNHYYCLPKSFSRSHIVLSFIEKRVFDEPIRKLSKVLRVLLSGDTYNNFYKAPEEKIK